MTTWIHYTMVYEDSGNAVEVAVSNVPEVTNLFRDINNFWSGATERLERAGGDLNKAVLSMLCRHLMYDSVTEVDPFGRYIDGKVEGWPALDGSQGVKLLSMEFFRFDGNVSIQSRAMEQAEKEAQP